MLHGGLAKSPRGYVARLDLLLRDEFLLFGCVMRLTDVMGGYDHFLTLGGFYEE
jgi:hypothetical protein